MLKWILQQLLWRKNMKLYVFYKLTHLFTYYFVWFVWLVVCLHIIQVGYKWHVASAFTTIRLSFQATGHDILQMKLLLSLRKISTHVNFGEQAPWNTNPVSWTVNLSGCLWKIWLLKRINVLFLNTQCLMCCSEKLMYFFKIVLQSNQVKRSRR